MNRHQKEIDKEQVFYEMFQYSSDRYNQTQLHSHCGLLQEIFCHTISSIFTFGTGATAILFKSELFPIPCVSVTKLIASEIEL